MLSTAMFNRRSDRKQDVVSDGVLRVEMVGIRTLSEYGASDTSKPDSQP